MSDQSGETGSAGVAARGAPRSIKQKVAWLYHGDGERPRQFRLGLLALDVVTISFFIGSSMLAPDSIYHWIDYPVALMIAADLGARAWISPRGWRYLGQFQSIADILVIASLLAHIFIDNLSFLRVVRMMRLFRSYKLLSELRGHSRFFARNEEIIHSSLNLLIFIFVVTAIVFVLEEGTNPNIKNYVDALYFTVTTLTTTGFGDITMTGTGGRLVAVAIMLLGVALFLRLVQTIFRPKRFCFPAPIVASNGMIRTRCIASIAGTSSISRTRDTNRIQTARDAD